MTRTCTEKENARQVVWDRLQAEGLARFPFPPNGRIPNFKGAQGAALRLFQLSPWGTAKRIKVNPDAPQRFVREEASRGGITVFVPTPRLRGGFKRLDPADIPKDKIVQVASLSKGKQWAEDIPLEELPRMDAIVCGSVAVTRDGRRFGKGEGYSDLPLSVIVTPEETIRIKSPPPAPNGIAWDRLTEKDFEEMPVLKELRKLRSSNSARR
jgi:5-formyltetrahydrofolate cyclo-ligase